MQYEDDLCFYGSVLLPHHISVFVDVLFTGIVLNGRIGLEY